MASFKITYFNGKGLAEGSRLLLSATETPFEDHRYPFEVVDGKYIKKEFEADKAAGVFPMGQVPLLTVTENGDTLILPQSKAIERYIAKKTGLAGSNDFEAAQIDAVTELAADIKTKFYPIKGDAEKVEAFFKDTFLQLVGYAEKYIAQNGRNGWSVGGKVSQADVALYHLFTHFFDASLNVREKLPAGVIAVVDKVAALPGIAAWEAGRQARREAF